MNKNQEKTIFESLYWLVNNTDVELSNLDSKQIILDNLAKELIRLNPTQSNEPYCEMPEEDGE
jgi:hypothetical protein